MARLNISLPDDVYQLAGRWRGSVNLSEVCARALRAELEGAESERSARTPLGRLRSPSSLERRLTDRFGLRDAMVVEAPRRIGDLREALGFEAASFFDQNVLDGSVVGIAGGRQNWCVVRNLSPRNLGLKLTALGIRQNDPEVLHAHPNTLVTLLWLLYSPRSQAFLVGSEGSKTLWEPQDNGSEAKGYFILASCGPFDPASPLARLLGKEAVAELQTNRVIGDFGYTFFSRTRILDVPRRIGDHSVVAAAKLQQFARRDDSHVLLVGGGTDKFPSLKLALHHRLCNAVVTDTRTAERLLEESEVDS